MTGSLHIQTMRCLSQLQPPGAMEKLPLPQGRQHWPGAVALGLLGAATGAGYHHPELELVQLNLFSFTAFERAALWIPQVSLALDVKGIAWLVKKKEEYQTVGLKHGSDRLAQGHLLSQNWTAISAEEFGFSAGPEAYWKILWKKISKLPLSSEPCVGLQLVERKQQWFGGGWGELMEDRRSGAQGCLLWPGLSEAGPSALLGGGLAWNRSPMPWTHTQWHSAAGRWHCQAMTVWSRVEKLCCRGGALSPPSCGWVQWATTENKDLLAWLVPHDCWDRGKVLHWLAALYIHCLGSHLLRKDPVSP